MPRLLGPLARVEPRRVARPGSEHSKHVGVLATGEPAGPVAHGEHDDARHRRVHRVPYRETERGSSQLGVGLEHAADVIGILAPIWHDKAATARKLRQRA